MKKFIWVLFLSIIISSSCERAQNWADKVNNGMGKMTFSNKSKSAEPNEEIKKEKMPDDYSGVWKNYSEEGVLISQTTYKEGIKNGLAKQFYSNGIVMLEINYLDGEQQGISKKFYKSGKIYRETPYDRGFINGIVKKYYEDGKIMAEIPYENGYQVNGLKEYTQTAQLIKSKPSILFTEIDRLSTKKRFILEIGLDKFQAKAKFYVNKLPDEALLSTDYVSDNSLDKFIFEQLKYTPLPIKEGKGIIDILALPGYSYDSTIKVIVRYETRLRNFDYVEQTYRLKIKN